MSILKKYLLPSEKTKEDLFLRVSNAISYGDPALAKRLYEYMINGWYTPATPVLLNAGTERGLCSSCFLVDTPDSLDGIFKAVHEIGVLSKAGGGLGVNISNIRGNGSPIKGGELGYSTGIQPFAKLIESGILASAQSMQRRGSAAVFLKVNHPDIETFLSLRESKGDMKQKTPDLFTGVTISDDFMVAVDKNTDYELICPNAGNTGKFLHARTVLRDIVALRHETGLPYIFFEDNANRSCLPIKQKELGLNITLTNLCTEITSIANHERTGTCILSCINLAKYDEFKSQFNVLVEDIITSLDNICELFIEQAAGKSGFEKALFSVKRSRDIGLGFAGMHDYFLNKNWPFDSVFSRGFDYNVTKELNIYSHEASKKLAKLRGECPDQEGEGYRNARLMTMMPSASTSQLLNTSKSIEPYQAPCYALKSDGGNKIIKLRQLEKLIGRNSPDWEYIAEQKTVQNLDSISAEDKKVFRNAFEISQKSLISMAAERQKAMSENGNRTHCQSLNLFYSKGESLLRMIEDVIYAYEQGVVSLYYVYSDKNHFRQDDCLSCSS